jgi:hypothetical protein
MDRQTQHRANIAKEKHWIDDARRDQAYLTQEGHRLIRQGKNTEGLFVLEEAKNAGSWITKRQGILRKEERLAGK